VTPRTDWTIPLAIAATVALLAMVAITYKTGVSQEGFELVRRPAAYAADLRAHPQAVRAIFAIDTAFLVLYSAAFVSFGRAIATPATRWYVTVGVVAILATALLDMIEDHHILAMLYGAEVGTEPTAGQLTLQHTISQVKFNVSYLGLFLIGLAVPRRTLAGKALALLLTVSTLVQGVWLYAAPVAAIPAGNLARWIGFAVGFALMIQVSRRQAAAAAATGARV
jgi:hypothetical protein